MKNKIFLLFAPFLFLAACQSNNEKTNVAPMPPPAELSSVSVPDSLRFCRTIAGLPGGDLRRAVGGKDKFWTVGQNLTVSFIGGTETQRTWVRDAFGEWAKVANLKFTFLTSGNGTLRIAFNSASGAWSYVGKDNAQVTSGPTMNIGWHEGATGTPSAYTVELHEIGHALGLFHEHQNPQNALCWNRANVIADLSGPPNNWNQATIEFNVLNTLPTANVITTAHDPLSIMHYNIPARWLCSGPGIPGGKVLSTQDKAFISARYPFTTPPPTTGTITVDKAKAQDIFKKAQEASVAAGMAKQKADSVYLMVKSAFGL